MIEVDRNMMALILAVIFGILIVYGFIQRAWGKGFKEGTDLVLKSYGSYPCIDYLNNALRFLLRNKDGDRDLAIEEIMFAIHKADGIIYDDVAEMIEIWKSER